MNETQFEKDLSLDLENLETEAVCQPELYFKYCSLAREAQEAFQMAKLDLSITEAQLAQKIRENPKAFGLTKTTETAIKEAIILHPKYREAYQNMVKARGESDILGKAEQAMDQRKRMIESLVQLYGREYFSGPDIAHTPKVFNQQIRKKKGEILDETMKRKVRKRKSRD